MSVLRLEEALKQRKVRAEEYGGIPYLRCTDDLPDAPRGTAAFEGDIIVYGYPHIGRILTLRPGLTEQFASSFWAEEKIDGYNVRICRIGDQVLALSRGGFACPFTTDRLPDLMDVSLFDHEPDLVVCAEVGGPENPYLKSTIPGVAEGVRLFAFDLMRLGDSGFLSQAEKCRYIERYRLPAVAQLGRYTVANLAPIRDILRRFNDQGREGVVFKEDSPRGRRAKYVTSNASISDIRATARSVLDLPPEYFTGRILRLVLFLAEQRLQRSADLDRRLGAAFLDGLLDAIEQFRAENRVYDTHRCRFRQRENAVRLLEHLARISGKQVQIVHRDLRREGDYWVLEFDRVYPSMNGMLGHLLAGGMVFD